MQYTQIGLGIIWWTQPLRFYSQAIAWQIICKLKCIASTSSDQSSQTPTELQAVLCYKEYRSLLHLMCCSFALGQLSIPMTLTTGSISQSVSFLYFCPLGFMWVIWGTIVRTPTTEDISNCNAVFVWWEAACVEVEAWFATKALLPCNDYGSNYCVIILPFFVVGVFGFSFWEGVYGDRQVKVSPWKFSVQCLSPCESRYGSIIMIFLLESPDILPLSRNLVVFLAGVLIVVFHYVVFVVKVWILEYE